MQLKPEKSQLTIKALRKCKKINMVATGYSMTPLIESGTKLEIVPSNFNDIKVSDIVAIDHRNTLIIHKCIFRSEGSLITWGINNGYLDPPFQPDQVIGKVILSNPYTTLNFNYHLLLTDLRKSLPRNIDFIILKGGPWQKYIYGSYLNQPTSDVDILINPQDYHLVKSTLEKKGFKLSLPYWLKKNNYSPTCAEFGEINFSQNINGITYNIDLHIQPLRGTTTKFISLFPKDLNKILNKIFFECSVNKSGFNYLCDTHQLLYLCLNLFFQHALRGINLYSYIAHLVANRSINWPYFWQLCCQLKVKDNVFYSLSKTSFLFNLLIPQLKDNKPPYLQQVLMKFFANKYFLFKVIPLGHNLVITRLNTLLIISMTAIIKLFPSPHASK